MKTLRAAATLALLGVWLALALFAGQASAAEPNDGSGLRLVVDREQASEVAATVGQPIELRVEAWLGQQPAAGHPLAWTLEDEAAGTLDRLDASSRAGSERIKAGSGRARFTPASAGLHAVQVQAQVEPGCVGEACRRVTHRFLVRAQPAPEATAESGNGRTWALAAGSAAALAVLATVSSSGSEDGIGSASLAAVAGNGQSGLANAALPLPLEALALNGGRPAAGVTLQWVASGGARLSAASSVTGANGRGQVSVTSLGAGPGPVTVTATRGDGGAGSAVFTLNIDIPALEKISGDGQTARVDTTTAAPLVVRTLVNGVPQAGVGVQWQVLSGNASLSSISAVSDASGLAQAFVDVGAFPGTVSVRASRVDSPLLSQTFTVNAVELRSLAIVSGDGQDGPQNATLQSPLVVLATDTGVGEPGVTIFWSVSGDASLSANTSVTDAAGEARVSVTLGLDLDPVIVSAFRADQPAISVDFSLGVLPPSLAVTAGGGQSGLAGSQAASPVVVQLLDGAGQPMVGQPVRWRVLSGSATLLAPVSVTDTAGLATVGYRFGGIPGPVVIQASAFLGAATANATATALAPGAISALSGDGQTGNPGDALPQLLVVQLVDPANDLSGVPVVFTVLSGSATLAPATVLTDASGQASTQVTLGLTPGPVVIRATAPGGVVTQFNANVTGTLVVTGFTANAGDAQTLTPGVASAPMVVELIGNGVPVVGETVLWSTTGGTLASASTVTDANGRSSNTVTVTGAGTTVVTASFPTFAAFVGSSITFTHNSGLAGLPSLSINEASVAEALDSACANLVIAGVLTPDEQDLLDQCQALTAASVSDPAAVGEALTAMLPDVAQTQADAGHSAVGAQFENLNSRMVSLRSGAPLASVSVSGLNLVMSGGRVPLAQLGAALMDPVSAAQVDETTSFGKWAVFVSGNIGRGEADPTRLTPRYDFDTDGLTAGVDYRWSDALVLGVALGYTRQDTELAGGQGSVDMDGLSLSGYSTWYRQGDWYLDSVLTLGNNSYAHQRQIRYVLPGEVVDQTAKADSDGTNISATATFGRDFAVRAWTFGAYGRTAYSRLGFDEFRETVDASLNGNGLALRVESRTVTGLSSSLGGKASFAHSASWGVLVPQLEVEWLHEFRSDAEAFRGFFIDDPTGTPILVLGDDLDSDYVRVGLALAMVLTEGRSGFVSYERVVARSGISQQNLSLGFRWEF